MRLWRAIALGVSAAVSLSAVAPGIAVAQNAELKIDGPQWQLVTYRDESGDEVVVPPGIGVTMLLFRGTIFGEAACSDYEGEYLLTNRELTVFPPTITPRTCEPAAQRIDDAFYSALSRVGTFGIEGSALRLQDVAGETLLTFTAADVPDDPTIAPWRMRRIADADGASGPVIDRSTPSVRFLPGGRLVGSTGCGFFLGSWETRASLISITDVDFRHLDCVRDLRNQADLILATMDEISDFTVRPAGLSLEDQGGVARLALVPDIPLLGRNWTPVALFETNGDLRPDVDQLQTSSIRFEPRSRVSGRTPCQDYSGRNQRWGLAVTVFNLETENVRCNTKKKREAETAFLAALARIASHALRGSELELLDRLGQPVMRLGAQPGLRDLPWVVVSLDKTPNSRKPTSRAPKGVLTADFQQTLLTGETGRTGFTAFYEETGASSIKFSEVAPSIDRGCGGNKKNSPACREEALYLRLLREADGFEMRPAQGQMVLLRGNRVTIVFEPAASGGGQG
jgi:heat shock protein HslJ